MLSYITSFFKTQAEISLEQACDILHEQEHVEEEEPQTATDEYETVNNFDSCLKTGYITSKQNDEFTIDNLYKFSSSLEDLAIGSKVSYNIFLSKGIVKVTDVALLENDWNVVETKQSKWCSRIIICKVEKRMCRELILSPGRITVNLNNISTEFVPIVGDWVELDVKSTLDENFTDLGGKILEINKIMPVRPHMKMGNVSNYDSYSSTGVINRNIFFNGNSLSCGYIPVQGDKVVAEIIESEQNTCSWRALKVIPEYLTTKNYSDLNNIGKFEFETSHEGLEISDNDVLLFRKLNETQSCTLTVTNVTSDKNFKLVDVKFLNKNTQCKLITKSENVSIQGNTKFEICFECISKNAGESKEFILFTFEDFQIGQWISIKVDSGSTYSSYTDNKYNQNMYKTRSQRDVVRGQKLAVAARFINTKLPDYTVPEKLLQTVAKFGNNQIDELTNELRRLKPVLSSHLTLINYEDKFHTLLHLDEIKFVIDMQKYDQEQTCFIPNNEYLMMEIENLAEKRPSIIVGDKILARDSLNNNNKCDFEGIVHKVGAKHIYLRFSQIFHDTYKGEDYSIRVIATRTSYRRKHYAVHLAVRNLGNELLFPNKFIEKDPQVCLQEEKKSNRQVLSPQTILKKMQEFQNKTQEERDIYKNTLLENKLKQSNNVKLKWYNESLNVYQKKAVKNILLGVARPLPYIIFGPPGTGKTVTVVETILQLVRHLPQSRLLVTAPSNSAADLLALKLIASGVLKPGDLVRLVSHRYVTSEHLPVVLAPYCATGSLAREGTSDHVTVTENGLMLGCSTSVLGRHRITVSTCNSAGALYAMGFPKGHFTHIIVDEAGQSSEPEVMIPLAFLDTSSSQAILAGDPMQLGPVVLSIIAGQYGLQESYLERLINRFPYLRDVDGFPESGGYDPRLVTKLLYNYRSVDTLLKLTSSLFYNDDLLPTISDSDVNEKEMRDRMREILPLKESNEVPSIVFHGVNGTNYQTSDSPSWFNPDEAAQVFYYINEFYRLGFESSDIGVVTPYVKQVKEIRKLLEDAEFSTPKIGSVEDFQGQEFNIIILSTVRSSQAYISKDIEHSLGFVSSPRRVNVALSRAKSLLVIIGNPNLLRYDTYWRTVIKYCMEHGCYTGCELISSS